MKPRAPITRQSRSTQDFFNGSSPPFDFQDSARTLPPLPMCVSPTSVDEFRQHPTHRKNLNDSDDRIEKADVTARVRLIRALSNPFRVQLLVRLQEQTASAEELAQALGSLSVVRHHVRVLEEAGCVEEAPEEADPPRLRICPDLFLDPLGDSALGVPALEAEEFHQWTSLLVDTVGYEQVLEVLRSASRQFLMIEEQSAQRLAILPEAGARLVGGVVAFHLPEEDQPGPEETEG